MKKRILVAGATGFIGRNIIQALCADPTCDVVGLRHKSPPYDLPGLSWRQGDLRDHAAVDRALQDIDIVIQAAATTSGAKDIAERPAIHVTDNAVMNSLLFRAAAERSVQHLVFFSCSIMYPSSDRLLKEEDFDANQPLKPYYFGAGWTKVYLEKMAEFFATTSKTRFTVLRHTNIYGPFDKFDLERSHMIGATIAKALAATDGKLTIWGSGEEVRDVLHVDDLTEAVLKALSRQTTPFELFNIGLGRAVPVRELAAQIVRASGRDLAIACDTSKPSLPFKVALDCAKAERLLGWKPKVQPEEGLARTVAWRKSSLSGET